MRLFRNLGKVDESGSWPNDAVLTVAVDSAPVELESRIIILKLAALSWRDKYWNFNICSETCWNRAHLVYHGRRGFHLVWWPCG